MKKRIMFCMCLISIIYCFFFLSLPHIYSQEELLTLYGKVTDESTGKPLSGVEVSIANTDYKTKTDDEGKYLFNLPKGEYEIIFSLPEYKKLTKKVKLLRRSRILNVSLTSLITYIGEELVVTAVKPAFKKPEPSKIAVQQEVIKETSGPKEDVIEVFKTLPGVSVSDDITSIFSVRGGSPREISVRLDDIYVLAPFHFDDMMFTAGGLMSIFSNEMIEKATLYSGGFPAKYGNVMSAVIDIKSKEAKERQGKVSVSFIDSKAFFELPIGKDSGLLFSARRNYQDVFLKILSELLYRGEGVILPSFYDMHLKFHTKLTPNNILSIYGIKAGADVIYETKGEYERPTGEKHKYTSRWARNVTSDLIFARLEHNFNEQWSFLSSLSFQNKYWSDALERRSTYPADDAGFRIKRGYQLYALKNELHFKPVNHHIKLGIVYTPYEAAGKMEMFGFGLKLTDLYKERTYILESYIQDSWEIFDRLTLNYGIRYDFLNLNKDKNFSPRVSLAFGITPKTTLRTSWGHYYQNPDMTDFYPVGFFPGWGDANKELKASLCHHYIVGIERELPANLNLRIEGYYKDYDKLIVTDLKTNRQVNTGEGFSRGIELFLERRLYRKLFGWISYTYSESKRRDHKHAKEYWFDFDERHIINVVVNYKFNPNWRVNVIWRYSSGKPYTPFYRGEFKEGGWTAIEGEKNSARLPPYHRLDLRITRNWIFKKWQLGLYLEIINLYNRKNVWFYVWDPLAGKEEAIPHLFFRLLPFLGIEARF